MTATAQVLFFLAAVVIVGFTVIDLRSRRYTPGGDVLVRVVGSLLLTALLFAAVLVG